MGRRERLMQQIRDAEARLQRIGQRLTTLREARDLETRVEEKLRLDAVISEAQKSQAGVSAEIAEMEAQENPSPPSPNAAAVPIAQSQSAAPRVHLFAVYAPQDEAQVLELDKHLTPLRRAGLVSHCHQATPPGHSVREHIECCYREADLILAFLSPDFLSKDECVSLVERAMEEGEGRRLIPILLRSSGWQSTALGGLASLPSDGSTISEARNKDQAWQMVVKGLQKTISHRS